MKNPSFHRFPRDNKNLRAWKIACHIESSIICSHFYVCDDNFIEGDYINHLKQRVTFNAVPSASKKAGDEKSTEPCQPTFDAESSSTGLHNHTFALRDITNSNSKPDCCQQSSNISSNKSKGSHFSEETNFSANIDLKEQLSNSYLRDNNSIPIDEELPPNSNLPYNN